MLAHFTVGGDGNFFFLPCHARPGPRLYPTKVPSHAWSCTTVEVAAFFNTDYSTLACTWHPKYALLLFTASGPLPSRTCQRSKCWEQCLSATSLNSSEPCPAKPNTDKPPSKKLHRSPPEASLQNTHARTCVILFRIAGTQSSAPYSRRPFFRTGLHFSHRGRITTLPNLVHGNTVRAAYAHAPQIGSWTPGSWRSQSD
jgi:hypothetical protein